MSRRFSGSSLGHPTHGLICAQVPNPYYAEGSDALHYWARGLAQIYERVEQRPFESRIPRAFWRGMIRNHDLSLIHI